MKIIMNLHDEIENVTEYYLSDNVETFRSVTPGPEGPEGSQGPKGDVGISVHHTKGTSTTDPEGDFTTQGEVDTYTLYGDANETLVLGSFTVANGANTYDLAIAGGYNNSSEAFYSEIGSFAELSRAAQESKTGAQIAAANSQSSENEALIYRNEAEGFSDSASASESSANISKIGAEEQTTLATAAKDAAEAASVNAASSESRAIDAKDLAERAKNSAEVSESITVERAYLVNRLVLGEKSEDPIVDNNGDPLTSGTIYFNTTTETVKFYDGTLWRSPTNEASESASESALSASAALASENAAELSASQAALGSSIYPTIESGLVNTVNGTYFSVIGENEVYLKLYLNNEGVAEFQNNVYSTIGVDLLGKTIDYSLRTAMIYEFYIRDL